MELVKRSHIRKSLRKNKINIKKIYDLPCIFVYHNHNWDGGYFSSNGYGGKKEEFCKDLNEILEFFKALIQHDKINECIIFPQAHNDIFEKWSDINEISIYRKLSALFELKNINNKNKNGLIFDPCDHWDLIENIVEGGFLFISYLYIYLPQNKLIIYPSHHFEFVFYNYNMKDFEFIQSCISTKFNMLNLLKKT